jgi:short-subunit dehydrogenase
MLDSHEFARNGYRVAMIARHAKSLTEAADEINNAYSLDDDSKAVPFPISEYSRAEIERVFEEIKKTWPGGEIRVAVYNTGHRVAKPFLELTQEDIGMGFEVHVIWEVLTQSRNQMLVLM